MFQKMNPQPGVGDVGSHVIEWHEDQGLGILDYYPDGAFIPFPGLDPIGVRIVRYNDEWYWAKPSFVNPTQPLKQVIKTLEPFKELFSDRQMRLIANALNYSDNDPAGLGGHQAVLLVAHLFTLVGLMGAQAEFTKSELAELIERFYACHLLG